MLPAVSLSTRNTGLLSLCLAIFSALSWRYYQKADHGPHTTQSTLDCTHSYDVQVLSMDPMVLYLDGFLKPTEVRHLIEATKHNFEDSYVYLANGTRVLDKQDRVSKSTLVDRGDVVSQCLDKRMAKLLGNLQHDEFEALHVIKYDPGNYFNLHHDWLDQPIQIKDNTDGQFRKLNRLASIFVYLEGDDCVGGETYFPHLTGVPETADGSKFSRSETGQGLLVRPRRGSAVFWKNVYNNGTVDNRMVHASLPVVSGIKIGMNMFGLYDVNSPLVGHYGE